jgi:hypothetical protein
LRPGALADVEQQRPGGIGRVGAERARQLKVDVILGQHDVAHPRKRGGLALPQPQYLGGGEAGECPVAYKFREGAFSHVAHDALALDGGALVAPDDAGRHHFEIRVEED